MPPKTRSQKRKRQPSPSPSPSPTQSEREGLRRAYQRLHPGNGHWEPDRAREFRTRLIASPRLGTDLVTTFAPSSMPSSIDTKGLASSTGVRKNTLRDPDSNMYHVHSLLNTASTSARHPPVVRKRLKGLTDHLESHDRDRVTRRSERTRQKLKRTMQERDQLRERNQRWSEIEAEIHAKYPGQDAKAIVRAAIDIMEHRAREPPASLSSSAVKFAIGLLQVAAGLYMYGQAGQALPNRSGHVHEHLAAVHAGHGVITHKLLHDL